MQTSNNFDAVLYTGTGTEQHIGSGGAQHPQDTTTIANSVRFEDGDNNYLTKSDQGTSSSDKQFTFSCWVKRGNLGSYSTILGTPEGGHREYFGFIDTNEFIYQINDGTNLISNRKFLNTSGWYHVVVAVNINESTASDRQKIYINGEQITSFSSANYYGSSDTVQFMKNGAATFIGRLNTTNVNSFDGYMAEINFIDGSTLDPTYFGQVGSNGYWIPKALSGLTYGTNGFRLTFENSSYLGYDYQTSDRSTTNDFTVSGLAATDHSIDSPTQNFATIDTDEYGVISGSAATSEGNTAVTVAGFSSTLWGGGFSTIEVPYGFKAYVELRANANGSNWGAGVCLRDSTPSSTNSGGANSVTYYNRAVVKNGTQFQYHSDDGLGGNGDGINPLATGNILSIAVDGGTGDVWFANNGTYFKPVFSNNTSGDRE